MAVFLPVMTAAAIPAGSVTALLLRAVIPALKYIGAREGKAGSRTCV
jgi:hypothetical protein